MSLISLPSDLQSPTICYYSAERKQLLYFLRKHLHHHRWLGDNRITAFFYLQHFPFMLSVTMLPWGGIISETDDSLVRHHNYKWHKG